MAVDDEARDLYHRARYLMDSGSLEEAVALFRESASLNPHFKTLELLGECLCLLGRWSDAVIPLAAATALNRQVRAPALLAQTFLELNDNRSALRFAELALTREENNSLASSVREIAAQRREQELRRLED